MNAMSYLPNNPNLRRVAEAYRPVQVCTSTPPPAPSVRREPAWSASAFGATVLLLCGLAIALMAWGAFSALPRLGNTEKLLRAQLPPPKLMEKAKRDDFAGFRPIEVVEVNPPPVHAEPPAPMKFELPPVLPPPTPEPLKIELPAALPPPAPARIEPPAPPPTFTLSPPPVVPLPPITAVEAVLPLAPERHDPLVFIDRAQPGETPMIRTWKTLALYSLLAAAPLAAPTPVVAGGQDNEKLQKQFDDLRALLNDAVKTINAASKNVDGLRKDITKVEDDLKAHKLNADVDLTKTNTKLENLDKQLSNLQADVNFIKRELSKHAAAGAGIEKAGLDDLKKQLSSIEQAILKLQPAESTTKRIALSPPAPTGRVILANMHHEELLIIVNQKAHRIAPGAVLPLDSIPAGTVSYELISPTWGQRSRNAINLPANETITLTAR